MFEVNFPGLTKIAVHVNQVTNGDFDVNEIVGFSGNNVIVTRSDMNHASEIFSFELKEKNVETIYKCKHELLTILWH